MRTNPEDMTEAEHAYWEGRAEEHERQNKRIAELEAIVSRYIDDTCPRCGTFENWTLRTNGERVCNNCYAVIEHHPPEGGADE